MHVMVKTMHYSISVDSVQFKLLDLLFFFFFRFIINSSIYTRYGITKYVVLSKGKKLSFNLSLIKVGCADRVGV